MKKEEKKREQKKYTVKPPKDLRSKFELMLDERKRKEEEEEEAKRRKEEEEKLAVRRGEMVLKIPLYWTIASLLITPSNNPDKKEPALYP